MSKKKVLATLVWGNDIIFTKEREREREREREAFCKVPINTELLF